ncbi:GNAT family N-acetyltransferase [Maribellus maritimus]|uniref:GNAT family N-acetyltransferase n=1 Tax=Maribellus maritimus TaxID=2870838 RepID=UPI001EEA0685|nr:N-acetyltransferase [Maribellus maritimus]MCG6187855.1 N-acetyltransferase [Maribellus maritimus]
MKLRDIQIRETDSNDFNSIMTVEERAFGYDKEAQLTAALLQDKTATPILSLLAFYKNEPVGHILFTRVYINHRGTQPLLHILAPLAVIPEYQKQGVGGILIQEGLKSLKKMGSEMVFVLGHMDYYPKHGFTPDAAKQGYSAPYPIPEEFANAWMVQSLSSEGFTSEKGKIICSDELNKPEHWRE